MMATFGHVLKMARWMEHKLSKNRHKGDESGWRQSKVSELLDRVIEEAQELRDEIDRGGDSDLVWAEAADVANMAMMVADTYECELMRNSRTR